MPAGFRFYRLLCASPPDVDPEREAFESSVARFNEEVLMPAGVLFAPASLQPTFRPATHSAPVIDNIRSVDFFLQIFGEKPADPAFPGFVDLALACVADPACPLRAVVVLFPNDTASDSGVGIFLENWAKNPRCLILGYQKDEIEEVMRGILTAWYQQCR